jgi:SMC interacting uncharacterized protein involved in chromosome segregation
MTTIPDEIRNKEKELENVKQELYELKNQLQDNVLLINEEEEMVTVVRRIISFEEVVMTKKDFMKLNKDLKDPDEYCYKIEELRESMYDIGFDTAPDQFTAFTGDITSYTDDMLFVSNPHWSEDGPIKLLNYSRNLIENVYEWYICIKKRILIILNKYVYMNIK